MIHIKFYPKCWENDQSLVFKSLLDSCRNGADCSRDGLIISWCLPAGLREKNRNTSVCLSFTSCLSFSLSLSLWMFLMFWSDPVSCLVFFFFQDIYHQFSIVYICMISYSMANKAKVCAPTVQWSPSSVWCAFISRQGKATPLFSRRDCNILFHSDKLCETRGFDWLVSCPPALHGFERVCVYMAFSASKFGLSDATQRVPTLLSLLWHFVCRLRLPP